MRNLKTGILKISVMVGVERYKAKEYSCQRLENEKNAQR